MLKKSADEIYRFLNDQLGKNVLLVWCPCDRTLYLDQDSVNWIKENGLVENLGLTIESNEAMTLRSKGRELIAFKI